MSFMLLILLINLFHSFCVLCSTFFILLSNHYCNPVIYFINFLYEIRVQGRLKKVFSKNYSTLIQIMMTSHLRTERQFGMQKQLLVVRLMAFLNGQTMAWNSNNSNTPAIMILSSNLSTLLLRCILRSLPITNCILSGHFLRSLLSHHLTRNNI